MRALILAATACLLTATALSGCAGDGRSFTINEWTNDAYTTVEVRAASFKEDATMQDLVSWVIPARSSDSGYDNEVTCTEETAYAIFVVYDLQGNELGTNTQNYHCTGEFFYFGIVIGTDYSISIVDS